MASRSPLYMPPWYFYTEEEKSFTVYKAYEARVLESSDVRSFLFKDRLNVWTTWAFPAVTYYGLTSTGILNSYIAYKYPAIYKRLIPAAISALLWVGWVNFSPFQKSLNNEKVRLLELCEKRIGVQMKKFNDFIPTFWTTQEIHRLTRQIYNQRHSVFTDILYPSEDSSPILMDTSNYPWKHRRNQLVK